MTRNPTIVPNNLKLVSTLATIIVTNFKSLKCEMKLRQFVSSKPNNLR